MALLLRDDPPRCQRLAAACESLPVEARVLVLPVRLQWTKAYLCCMHNHLSSTHQGQCLSHEARLGLKPGAPPLLVLMQRLQTCGRAPAASKLCLLWCPAAWGMPHRRVLNCKEAGLGHEGSQHVALMGPSASAAGFCRCFQVHTDVPKLIAKCRLILLATLLLLGQQTG